MGSKQLLPLDHEIVIEKARSFNKSEDGYYRITEETTTRDARINKVIERDIIELEGAYRIAKKDEDADVSVEIDDFDGSKMSLRFVKVTT
tara:strand:- start:533 stop:802 length:270 start_codon:yes stop_codon:yes gene_type:complete